MIPIKTLRRLIILIWIFNSLTFELGGIEIYKGNLTAFNNASLISNTTYYYKIGFINSGKQYSKGLSPISAETNSHNWVGGVTAYETDWFTAGNWDLNSVPTSFDDVYIPVSAINQPVINVAGAECNDIWIESGASLTMNETTSSNLSVSGDWTNNGTFNMGISTIDFNGTGLLQTIGGSSTTDFNILKVTKGAQDRILEAASIITLNAATNPLVLTSGTFKLSSASTIKPFTSSTIIGSTAGLWNNGGTINTRDLSWTLNGALLRISAGIINVGISSGNSIKYLYGGKLIIEGGELNIAGRFSPSSSGSTGSFTQSGGILTLNTIGSSSGTRGPFEINDGVPFTMSGGSIVIQNASLNTADYINLSETHNVTGGTLQIGNASTPTDQNIRINSSVPIYKLVVNSDNSPTAQLVTNGLTVKNDLTISGGALNANSLDLIVGGHWTNNGTFAPGTGLVKFIGSEIQIIGGSSATTFNNLTVDGADVSLGTSALSPVTLLNSNLSINTDKKLSIPDSQAMTVYGDLTNNGTLTINSDALAQNGSLIVEGTSTGNVTYNRYLVSERWFITSGPVNVTSGFDVLNGSAINYNTTYNDYDFAWYDELDNFGWTYYLTIPSSLTSGQGYLTKLSTDSTNISYTGELNGNIIIPVASSGSLDGWNAVGNPFTSAIKVRGTDGFITTNFDTLATDYAAIYLWNDGFYKVISNGGYTAYSGSGTLSDLNVQAGQGFLVNIKYNAGASSDIKFTKGTGGMQLHDVGTTLKSGAISWPGVTLLVENGSETRSTIVCFNTDMTTELDVSYDAGLLSNSNFDVYTTLVKAKGNKTDFAIQCLPENQYTQLVVPLGLNFPTEGEFTFKAAGIILPSTIYTILEDRKLKKRIPLRDETDSYTVNLTSSKKDKRRFYLRFADATKSGQIEAITGINDIISFTARYSQQKITIFGLPEEGTKASLYDINGRKIGGEYQLFETVQNEIPALSLISGVYFVKIVGESYSQMIKIPVIVQ